MLKPKKVSNYLSYFIIKCNTAINKKKRKPVWNNSTRIGPPVRQKCYYPRVLQGAGCPEVVNNPSGLQLVYTLGGL